MSRLSKAALAEIILLNEQARETKEQASREFAARENELVTRIEVQAAMLAEQGKVIKDLTRRLSEVPTTRPQRHVADEMGLREKLMACHEQLSDGMAKASGLVSEKEPDQK